MLGRMVEIKDMLGNHQIIRADGRKVDELRPVRITRHFTDAPEGSVLIECGNTRVMCTATFTPGVPRWRKDSGLGWVTAEYSMLPRATAERTDRESVRGKIGGRTHEISRLIGRCLRGVIDMKALGENQIQLDCDVLQADGGTRTASVTGAYVALVDAVNWAEKHRHIKSASRVLKDYVSAVSVGVINGTPMSFDGKQTITTLEGQEQVISQGPTAAIVPIKQLGTNGGGYFGTNSAHPLENPNAFTNILECWSILILPMAMAFAFGFYTRRRRLAAWIFAVMLFAYIAGVVFSVWQETGGSRQIDRMGIAQELGSMEGKEIRIGSAASAMWGMTTTVTSNGSVDSMHDSQTPLSGMLQMLNMQINCWFGGVGVGWMNYFAFLIIAVFISGLMVGRTPEFLGKKVEAREMKIATLVVLMHPFLILVGTGISAAVAAADPEIGWLNNPSFHGLSEMLYEYTSSAANNGSGFEGLADNTPFWNISTGIALIMGRYFPIVGQVAIAGLLASKKYIPESAGTLKTDTGTFSLMTFAVIIIVAALSFFPALALGPIADYLTF